jgi:cell division protein FtsB
MTHIIIAAVGLLLGFVFGFFLAAILSHTNNNEEELRQDLLLEKDSNMKLHRKIKKLKEENKEMEDQFLSLINNGKYNDTSNTL